ncbi:hypothetical protein O0L34_g1228 [Tuta absoluta]|nr:hypothetical protein O0L34_g1228 [Tuta absoluta]
MEKALEDSLYQAILVENQETVSQLLNQGANPNKTASHGKTCLGEAAKMGSISIVKLLIDASKSSGINKGSQSINRKRHVKTHKRKIRHEVQHDETIVKCRTFKDYHVGRENINTTVDETQDKNQGYFVFIHSEGSSSDEGRIPGIRSALSTPSLTPSPQADLEWDEEIGNVAPTTSEDETWSSMYKWYAAILECTGAAIASASVVTNGIDQQDAFMRTALHYAAEQGHTAVVKLLIDAGCKVDITASDGLTPLHVAVIRDYGEIVSMLLEAGSNANYKTHEKMTPLHFAASRGYLDLVKILVKHGANLEARDTSDRTALYLAAGRGHAAVVQFLVTSGANVNGEEIHGYTPLCEAVWQKFADVVKILLTSGARITHSHKLLHNAIIQRQVEIVQMLANNGGGINLHNDNGDTPLLLASRLAQPTVARILLEHGANVNACNSITGANALHVAVENVNSPREFEELLICLLDYKIDMNSVALTGDTALNRALLLHEDDATVLLIRYGADVNLCGDLHSCGLDNLSIASRRCTSNLASMLMKAGHYCPPSDPKAAVPDSGSAARWLHYASKQPLSLSDLCRIKIRHIGRKRSLFRYVSSLPLPISLKRYLMMEDEGA